MSPIEVTEDGRISASQVAPPSDVATTAAAPVAVI
jgi:hypothetical protein